MVSEKTAIGKIVSVLLAVFVASAFCGAYLQHSYAAAKKASPGRPVIKSAVAEDSTVTIKWSKVKRATKYKVYIRSGPNRWKYLKKIKKNSTNRNKYSNAVNYKITVSGKKYKLYKRSNPFRLKASVKKCSYSFTGEYGKSYAFIVKPYAGKTAGIRSKIKDVTIPPKEEELSPPPEQADVDKVKAYAARLYSENMTSGRDYLAGGFTWDQEYVRSRSKDPDAVTYGWKYFNALMMEAFISDDQGYIPEVLRFYDSHFDSDGNLLIAHNRKYPGGTVDTAMPAAPMIELVIMGAADEAQTANYNKAANTVYNKLENQYMYDGEDGRPYAGKIWMHHQMKDSETGEIVPVSAWSKWPVCLDGIYMSQIFLIRLAEAIDTGKMEIRSVDGHIVSSQELWSDIYTRLNYAADHLRIQKSGLMTHVYSPDRGEANNISWSRGTGWFMMAMLEAIDKMPDGPERQELQKQFDSIMRSVLEWQDPDSHLWYNVMTRKADLSKNRPETSGSAMLAYCLLKGYKTGILKDEEFRRAGLAAFNVLVNEHLDEEAGLSDTLISMGPADTEAAYQKPQFVTNEAKGIAPLIMAAEYVMP